MNAAVYFGVKLLTTVSIILVDIQGLEGRLYGFERQGDVVFGPTGNVIKPKGFAGTSQFPEKASAKHHLVHNFEWRRGELKRRTIRPTSKILSVNASEKPKTQDESGEDGPKMANIVSHLLTDYGIMGISGEEDSAKWAAVQMRNSPEGSREVNGSLVDTAESKLQLKNESMPQNQSSSGLQASSFSSALTQANVSENRQTTKQKGNLLKNLTLNIQQGLNKSLERQTNQSLNQNQAKLFAEPKANHTDGESSGNGSLVINVASLRPNQFFHLKFPNSTSAVNVRNRNLTFSENKEVEDITQETSGLLENTEPENDSNSLDKNTSSVEKGNGSDSIAHLEPGNTGTNAVVTTAEDLSSYTTRSQPINDRVASDALQLQRQSRGFQNSTAVEKAKLEVYDDESLAKALTDSSVSSIVFSNKSLSPDNYLLGSEGQKKSTLQGKQSKMKKHRKDQHNAVRRYLKAKKFSTNQRYKLPRESRRHVLSKKDNMVTPVQPPELTQLSKNDSRSNSEHTFGNGEQHLRDNDTLQQMKIQSNSTAQIPATSRPSNYGAEDNQRNAPETAHKIENYQAPNAALHPTQTDLTKNESRVVPSADPSQGPRKHNHEFLNNDRHENVTTSVVIQDDSGRTVYQGAVDIFKARNNVSIGVISNGNNKENQAFPNSSLKPNEKDQSFHETSLPEVKVAGQNDITSEMPPDAKLHKTVSNSFESIPSDISNSFAEQQGHDSRNYSRASQQQSVNNILMRNSSLHGMQKQSVENKSRPEQNTEPSAGETSDHRPLPGHQQQNRGPIEKLKETNDYDPRQQTYLQPPFQQQQNYNFPQNMQHETKYPGNGEAQNPRPVYEDDKFHFKEDVFHIVLHNDNKVATKPREHMTLTISGPLPTGAEMPVNSDGTKPSFQYNAEDFQSNHNDKQLDKIQYNEFPGNSGQQKTSAQMNNSDGHVQISQEKAAEDVGQQMLNQDNVDDAGIVIQGRLSGNNDLNKQDVGQPTGGSHSQENITGDSLVLNQKAQRVVQLNSDKEAGNQSSSKFMDNIFNGPGNENVQHQGHETGDQNATLPDQADGRVNSNMLVKATDRATASLSSMNGFASSDEIAAMEGPRIIGDVSTANPESHKLDCHVSPQPGKSSLTILTCRKNKFNSNTPQAFKPTFYYPQVLDEGVRLSRKTQGRVPRLDEVLNVLNQDTKESLNKEMMMEGKSIQKMLEGFANPKVTMYDSSEVGTDDDSPVFDWIPESHKRNTGDGFARSPWEMNMKSRTLWDPEHQIMLPSSLLKNYWRHLRRVAHRHHRPRFPWAPGRDSERGFWGFHQHVPLEGYGHFEPSWAPSRIWSHPGSFFQGLSHRKAQAFHQEKASKRTSLFNNILKGNRDNCRPREGGLHSHMGEWEYLGRVLCSCPFGVGEW